MRLTHILFFVIGVSSITSILFLSALGKSGLSSDLGNDILTSVSAGNKDREEITQDFLNGSHQMKNQKIGSNSSQAGSLERKFFLLESAQLSTNFIMNYTEDAVNFYDSALNEELIEVWLHKGFKALRSSRTYDITHASIVLIPFYGHFSVGRRVDIETIVNNTLLPWIHNRTTPHVVLCPSNNPKRSRDAGIPTLINALEKADVNVWSVGIERNPGWQGGLNPRRIIPIPYLVKLTSDTTISKSIEISPTPKRNSSFFYVGDPRPSAIKWSGCNRSMVEPLSSVRDWMVRISRKKERLSQKDYNKYIELMEFCLIICGDTPTSRSLASSIVHGCIPVFVGSRWQGKCEKPCKRGYGWAITHIPHLPYIEQVNWSEFPSIDEAAFSQQPEIVLRRDVLDKFSISRRHYLREKMRKMLPGWLYGVGNPVISDSIGTVAEYTWNSILHAIDHE